MNRRKAQSRNSQGTGTQEQTQVKGRMLLAEQVIERDAALAALSTIFPVYGTFQVRRIMQDDLAEDLAETIDGGAMKTALKERAKKLWSQNRKLYIRKLLASELLTLIPIIGPTYRTRMIRPLVREFGHALLAGLVPKI